MRLVVVIAVTGLSLAGCSSLSLPSPPSPSSWDLFKKPTLVVQLQLDSVPQGAEVRTSLGPGCRTPCTIPLTDPLTGFSVTYTLDQFLPVTVPVRVTPVPDGFFSWGGAIVDPNPVVAELQPVPPPPPPPKRKMKPRKPKPATAAVAPPTR
jgi:hypothetical protein